MARYGTGDIESRTVKSATRVLRLQRDWDSPNSAVGVDWCSAVSGISPSPLYTAAKHNFEHALRFLLANGALVDRLPSFHYTSNPLLPALERGNVDMAQILIEFGADVNVLCLSTAHNTTLLAAVKQDRESVKYLLNELKIITNAVDGYGRTVASLL